MKKLTDKTKYDIIDGDLYIYARLKSTGKFACVGSCHLSWLDTIKKVGSLKAAFDIGLVISSEGAYK
jgi:hypothetical protein